jgi:hypothetical protein
LKRRKPTPTDYNPPPKKPSEPPSYRPSGKQPPPDKQAPPEKRTPPDDYSHDE